MAKQVMVICRLCGRLVPGIATEHGVVAEPHAKDGEEVRCPGSNCPPANEPKNQGENHD